MTLENEIHVVVKAVIEAEEKVLIVKRSDDDEIGAGTWEFPGGKIEFEEEIEAALIREVKEETGLSVTVDHILYATSFFTDPLRKVVLITYFCQSSSSDVLLSEEHSNYMWVLKEEMRNLLPVAILGELEKVKFLQSLSVNQ
ncbi:DNA mismatch repair protein MutT [Fictibacillus phosphorivorans]|uniref:8-oxo-dGTP diphosphatase n=1 Tax=Fictibacillus phosphorivorans TaxID=1221500 RepID=A0A165P7L7_9BACL|nr:NUDIX domain-containing protein [Fictibacillus phosphorivorans]KZE69253.1 DNA mismatch repair protein MutT [Fictibacillus phosphorivorans]